MRLVSKLLHVTIFVSLPVIKQEKKLPSAELGGCYFAIGYGDIILPSAMGMLFFVTPIVG